VITGLPKKKEKNNNNTVWCVFHKRQTGESFKCPKCNVVFCVGSDKI